MLKSMGASTKCVGRLSGAMCGQLFIVQFLLCKYCGFF